MNIQFTCVKTNQITESDIILVRINSFYLIHVTPKPYELIQIIKSKV